jgi:hypothetical protein
MGAMHTRAVVLAVVAIASAGCLNTARYDTAHVQRVIDINAQYAHELRHQDAWHAASLAALDQLRASLIPVKPGTSSALGGDIESLLTRSHNQAVLHSIEEQTARIARARDQARQRLELARENEIRASTRLRDAEVASSRAAHRARLKIVARRFATLDQVAPPSDGTTRVLPLVAPGSAPESSEREPGWSAPGSTR